ncbi:MAG: glycosyl hydrolase 53 family protein [Lachnobacterium sp.]|nr:glycosyl hydrolase 53 family protein [Lachnobacterium sp.]
MKEKKQWKKRIVSMLMALAMVITQIGVWNAGKESVQAAETNLSQKTLYFEYSGENTLAVSIWDGGWNTIHPDENVNTWIAKVTNVGDCYALKKVDGVDNWYQLSLLYDGSNIMNQGIGFTIVDLKDDNSLDSEIAKYDAVWNKADAYKKIFSDLEDPAICELNRSEVVSYASLSSGDTGDSGETDSGKDTGDTDDKGDVVEETYTVEIIPSATEVEAGDEVTLTAKVKKGNTEITDLEAAGLYLYWWNNTTKSSAEFIDYDSNGHDLVLKTKLSTVGGNKIQAKLQDSKWADLVTQVKEITVNEAKGTVTNAVIAVDKVSNLSDDFIMGADISSMISELQSGVVYKDYDGNELKTLDDVVKFLAGQGINHIRVRVWNDPYDANGKGYGGGNNDVAKAKQFADACRNAGIKMLVDFHCSDLWTDPGKQQAPKAWKNYSLEQKKVALKTFIQESLNTIDLSKDVVDMVQVGNETTGGFIGETDTTKMCALFDAGSQGVKAYNENVKVVIHVESPQKGSVTKWAKNLQDNSVDYDIIATSYYPYWHGTLSNLKSEFEAVRTNYKKDVMVAETSYAYTLDDTDGHENTVRVGNNDSAADADQPFTEQGQATYLRNLIDAVNSAGGLGVYYWESAWITVGNTTGLTGEALQNKITENKTKWEKDGSGWASSYAGEYDANDAGKWFGGSAVDNQALFYADGTATPAMHVWNYVKTGSTSNLVSVEKIASVSETITQKVDTNDFLLPDTVAVTYSDAKDEVNETVTWDENDKAKVDASKVGTYQIRGTIALSKDITRGAYKGKTTASIILTLQVKNANLIKNADVAEVNPAAQDKFDISDTETVKTIANGENPHFGTCLSWWNGKDTEKSVTITYNEGIELEKGSYTFELYAQGNAGTDQVTLQILNETGEVIAEGEPASLQGWKVWQTPKVDFTLTGKNVVKLQIKIETQSNGWGSVDDLYLHENENAKDDSGNSGSSTVTPSIPSVDTPATDKKDDKSEVTTEGKKVTATTPSGEKIEATVSVSKDKDGNITEATATVTGTKAKISAEAAAEIAKAAGTDRIAITASVTDKNGNEKYTVTVDSKNLTANKKLHVVAVDPKTGEYKLVNAKTYKVGKDGTLHVKLADGADYKMLTATELKAVEKAILKTVEVKKSSVTVKNGKKTQIQLSSALDMDNVKSITYKTSKKSVATVSKSGKITTNKKGTVTIKAIVTLKNGKKKTVSMTLKVK